jgi:Leucine-rich repeat (LRR) protein
VCRNKPYNVSTLCIKEKREALLKIKKKDLKVPPNFLSSWIGKDFCNWKGIECDNQTGNILKLDLRYICLDLWSLSVLGGKINPALSNLKHLSYLDLSRNNFEGISIPEFIGSLNMLNYLEVSYSSLRGFFPSTLGRWNPCKLQNLDLTSNHLTSDITKLIEAFSCSNQSLEHLRLSFNQLTGKLPQSLGQFNSLYELDLSNNLVSSHSGVSGPIPASI